MILLKERKKRPISKLSIKIVLMLLVIVVSVAFLIAVLFSIIRATGFEPPREAEQIDAWMRGIVFIFPISMGIAIMGLFTYALNKAVVLRITKLKNATKDVTEGNYGIKLDVKGSDELSELADSFNIMSAELRANEYLSKEFVRNVSHEFKTPISVVKAYGELIATEAKQKDVDRAALEEYARVIMGEADRLTALSKNMLQLSLLDSTTIIKKDDSFCPAEQIRNILRITQVGWSEKDIGFDLNLEEFAIKSNEQLLYQVWQNLISNAVKFSPEGGKIKITLTANQEGLYFEIADNGAGISDEDKEKIFTLFFIADKSRNTEGSGLGLAIVKKIVEKLDGEICFESAEGKGTTFRVSLRNRAD